jgi:PelA/Pel-15E family pectate lyase
MTMRPPPLAVLVVLACVGPRVLAAPADGLRPLSDSVYELSAYNPDLHEHLLDGGYEIAAIAIPSFTNAWTVRMVKRPDGDLLRPFIILREYTGERRHGTSIWEQAKTGTISEKPFIETTRPIDEALASRLKALWVAALRDVSYRNPGRGGLDGTRLFFAAVGEDYVAGEKTNPFVTELSPEDAAMTIRIRLSPPGFMAGETWSPSTGSVNARLAALAEALGRFAKGERPPPELEWLLDAHADLATEPLPLEGFTDGIRHWQNSHHTTDYPRLAPDNIVGIADNILVYQRANGGWRENEDPLRILSRDEYRQIVAAHGALDTSLDNRNGWPQVEYLAGAYRRTLEPRYREGCLRGLEFILTAQHTSGGFPHSFPSQEEYRPYLTFADDVLPDILRTLRAIAAGTEPFGFIDAATRERAAEAVRRGDACILRLQVVQDGVPTVWAGQYHHITLAPVGARSFELPALVSRESVAVVRYLMSIDHPAPDVVRAIEAAAAWFERTMIGGWRVETFDAEPVVYTWHTSTTDRRMVEDPAAPPLWARFYDLATSEPFLANRDGKRVFTLAEVERERRTGYEWYGTWANALLERDLPAWRARVKGARSEKPSTSANP